MKFLMPLMTLFLHLLELVAAIVLFPLTAVCVLALMAATLYVALRPRPPLGARQISVGASAPSLS